MELNCLILNISPYGPQNDKGIGKNCCIQYIPLDNGKMTDKEKSYGYYVSYNVLYDNSQKSFFDYVKENSLILTPLKIKYEGSYKHVKISSIEKL